MKNKTILIGLIGLLVLISGCAEKPITINCETGETHGKCNLNSTQVQELHTRTYGNFTAYSISCDYIDSKTRYREGNVIQEEVDISNTRGYYLKINEFIEDPYAGGEFWSIISRYCDNSHDSGFIPEAFPKFRIFSPLNSPRGVNEAYEYLTKVGYLEYPCELNPHHRLNLNETQYWDGRYCVLTIASGDLGNE